MAAMKLLDKRGSGYIEFDEFVEWWVNKVCICSLIILRSRFLEDLMCLIRMSRQSRLCWNECASTVVLQSQQRKLLEQHCHVSH